jgi:aminoglycoside phosphotransferase (APT) family kinase protein
VSEFEERLSRVLARRIDGFQRLVSAERLSGGASQETYRVVYAGAGGERRLALRRGPGGLSSESVTARPGLATEALLMRCARAAGVPEPEVYHVLEPDDGLGEGFVMEWLEGETLGARIVRAEELAAVRPRLAHQCGEVLARIHAIDLAASGIDRRLGAMTPAEFLEQTWARYRGFDTPQPMIDYAARWLRERLPAQSGRALVHNDFRNGNIMVSSEGVVAVLDWETAHIGDPMRDLGWICTNSWRFGRSDLPVGGFGHYEDLFAGYEAISGERVDPDRVRWWEVFGSFWWAVGCLGMAHAYRTGPDRTVERPAIGRRSSECQVDCVNLIIPGPVDPIAPAPSSSKLDMPRSDELLKSVRDFLHQDVMGATQGRLNFLARVAGNSVDILLRELEIGPEHRRREHQRLRAIVGAGAGSGAGAGAGEGAGARGEDVDDLESLRWRLVHALRDGSLPLDAPGLAEHLRETVVNQVAIDQPRYSGLRTALEWGGEAQRGEAAGAGARNRPRGDA